MVSSKVQVLGFLFLFVLGVVTVIVGFTVFQQYEVKAVSGVLIGVGAGTAGLAVAQAATNSILARNPQLRHQLEIETKDERNVFINQTAKAKAFDFSIYVPLPVCLLAILMGASTKVILLIVGANVLQWLVYLWNLNKLYQKM